MNKPTQFTGRWFRHYEDALDDPKILALSNKEFRFLINCWCLASKNKGALPPVDQLGRLLRLRNKEVAVMVAALRSGEHPLLDEIDGRLVPHNWDQRQFKSDFSAERMRRHRVKTASKSTQNAHRTLREFTREFPPSHSKQTKIERPGDGLVTVPEADTDKEAASLVELRSRVGIQNPKPPAQNLSLREQEIIDACEPLTRRFGSLTPALMGTVMTNLNGAPVAALAQRVKERGPYAKHLWLVAELAKDAAQTGRERKPVMRHDPLGDTDFVPEWLQEARNRA